MKMTTGITPTIRRAAVADTDAMSALLQALFRIEADFNCDPDRQRRGLLMFMAGCGKHRAALVADCGGRLVGMATAQLVVSTAEGGLSAWVEDVVVDANWRGQGIGSRLLAGIADWAASAGASRLQLVADQNNGPALKFYRKHRWQSTRLICLRKRPAP